MSRTVPAPLAAHLALERTTLCTCWKITRQDGAVFRFTDHDVALTVDGDSYLASTGYSRAAIAGSADLSVAETEVSGILDDASITEQDLRNGLWDYAEVRIFATNWASPSDGIIKLRRGFLGEVTADDSGRFRAELRGLAQMLQQRLGEVYTAECRADFGDARCRMPAEPALIQRSTAYGITDNVTRAVPDFVRVPRLSFGDRRDDEGLIWECTTAGTTASSAPSYAGTAGTVVTDGTAAFTAREAWTVAGIVDAASGRSAFTVASSWLASARHVTGYFDGGAIIMETGDNAGAAREVIAWDTGARSLVVFPPFPADILAGDVFRVQPGCDKRAATCKGTFANLYNFRGEPHVPGQDALMQVGRQ